MDSTQTSLRSQVVCICGGFGFPSGVGSSARIVAVGKALQFAGTDFRVLHCGPSPLAINRQAFGVFEGIPFEYTTTLRRPTNSVVRAAVYLWAALTLTLRLARLWQVRQRTAIWLYILGGPTNLYVGWLCRLLRLPVVQELCEWSPGDPACSRFTKWLYRSQLFRNTTGVLAISRLIAERAKDAAEAVNSRPLIHRLPVIVDVQRFAPAVDSGSPGSATDPTFLWCGAQEWHKDVLFLIRAAAWVLREGWFVKVMIVGTCSEERRATILEYARQHGLPDGVVEVTGYVGGARLETLLRSATALLLPLSNDDRSRTRVPNKLGEYLASGRPVVTCKVGDVADFLEHGASAYMAEPDDERGFAEQMLMVLSNAENADRIGRAGQRICETRLDYRVHANALAAFFEECTARGAQPRRSNIARDDDYSRRVPQVTPPVVRRGESERAL